MKVDLLLLHEMLEQKYINVQKHPDADLYIYNYTAKAQYDRVWNEATLACRGLILDGEGNVVARPFKKFFNLGEFENQLVPQENFEVYEKMDGSLGISYMLNGKIQIATRGSFTSDQSVKANEMLYQKYQHLLNNFNPNQTYLFEIIYPENRIVVNYGEAEKLVLLAIIDRHSGQEYELSDIGFPIVPKYDGIEDIAILKTLEEENKEGFVLKYADGYRLKVKFDEYVRIHRIVTQVSSINIWEYLRNGSSLDEILDRVPDEFYSWVKKQKTEFELKYKTIELEAHNEFKILDTRKDTALYFMKCKHPSILFHMLDQKDYSQIIWKMLRPEYEKPFMEMDK